MASKDKEKIACITNWGAFASNVMNFIPNNVPTMTFQYMVTISFEEFLQNFMRVFIDKFFVFNPMKCAFCVKSGMLIGNIVSVKNIAMDPAKVAII